MRLSRQEAEYFDRLKGIRLSPSEQLQLSRRSPALADALKQHHYRYTASRVGYGQLKDVIPDLRTNQSQQYNQIKALHSQGYIFDLEFLKRNNPWETNNVSAIQIIQQLRPQWAEMLKKLARERDQQRRQTP